MSSIDYIEEIEKSSRYDHIVEVEKFNPYHDAKGRFSSAGGATSFTYKPGQGAMYDRAIQREKERMAAASATNDPSTIAGVKRGMPMTHEQADEGRANPEYAKPEEFRKKMQEANQRLSDAIYNRKSEEEKIAARKELDQSLEEYNKAMAEAKPFRNNCQSCVVAYEARLRGYDVEAIGRSKTNQIQEKLASNAESAWIDPSTGKAPSVLHNDPSIRTAKQAQKWLDQNVEEGGRYEFAHGWKGTNGYYGHIVTLTKDRSGSMRIFDPQNGKTYAGEEFTNYMSKVKSTYSTKEYSATNWSRVKSVPHGRLGLLRVDNLQLNESVANAVLKEAKG